MSRKLVVVVASLLAPPLHVDASFATTFKRTLGDHVRPTRTTQARATATRSVDVEEAAALAFGSALSLAWSNDTALLRQSMRQDANVRTPLWKCDSRLDYEKALLEATGFFSARADPTLTVLSHRSRGRGEAQVSWLLSVEWPSVWRSRVNIIGESVLTLAPSGGPSAADASDAPLPQVVAVRETWHQTPTQAFVSQVLPQARDLVSLWSTPTAEEVPQQLIEKTREYEVRQLPPMLVLQAEAVETGSLLFEEQAPMAPSFSFTGEVKRSEWYSTVIPGILERSQITLTPAPDVTLAGQRRRWVLPLPARFGVDPSALPDPDPDDVASETPLVEGLSEQSVQYVHRPAQKIAAVRVKGDMSNQAVVNAANKLAADVRASGGRVVMQQGRPVIMQLCYDMKYGYNARKQLSMAAWLALPRWLEKNEVAVLIDES